MSSKRWTQWPLDASTSKTKVVQCHLLLTNSHHPHKGPTGTHKDKANSFCHQKFLAPQHYDPGHPLSEGNLPQNIFYLCVILGSLMLMCTYRTNTIQLNSRVLLFNLPLFLYTLSIPLAAASLCLDTL